jgi:superfamily I DNA/RNA helicase
MPFNEKLNYLIAHTRLERIINDSPESSAICERILSSIEKNALNADAFFNGKALESDIDSITFDIQKVTLMTLHAAKGLEFPVVFVVGCEDGLIPFKHSEKEADRDNDEERRLFFVAMTRAKEQLFLTWARSRKRFGKKLARQLSPYISDIPDDLLVLQEPVYGKKRQQVQTQMKLF